MSVAMGAALKLAIFDCDGTLVDSQHAIADAMNAAWRALGKPDPDTALVRRVVGLSLERAVAVLAPEEPEERQLRLAACYREAFVAQRDAGRLDGPLYPGIRATLDALDDAGVLLAVATGKGRRGLDHVLATHGLNGRFVSLQTGDDAPGKPHPGMVLQALGEAGVAPADAVVIGDTVYDMEMAANAGVAALGVGWGYHGGDELLAAGARTVVGDGTVLAPTILDLLGLGAAGSIR